MNGLAATFGVATGDRSAELAAWLTDRFIPQWIERTCLPGRRDAAGKPTADPRPLWPTIELLRASLAAEALKRDFNCSRLIDTTLDIIFEHAMDRATGLWNNTFDEEARVRSDVVPTRVLYHIVPCFISYASRNVRS